ncbi:MAG: histone deacetylase [Saprospiraceae bacterium]|nr:histone deacetylase [Saprospiraceae bacterium]
MLKIAWSPIYKYPLPEGHRFPMIKYELLPEQLLYEGTVHDENFFHPDAARDEDILLTHTPEYLHKLHSCTLSAKEIQNIGFPMSELLVRRGKHITNGTYQCALYALQYGIAMNIAGGTHHSFADRGEGFCIFNDIAYAANLLLHTGTCRKILIIDLDVHQGNGTAKIFEQEDRVFTFSMHGEKNYPTRKENSSMDIGLPDHTEDKPYLDILRNTLPALIDKVAPDMIFYLSGVDVLKTDKLGRLSLSKQGCKERDRIVLETAKKNRIPIAVSMGGGYSPMLTDIVDAHANTFRLAQELFF